MPSLESYFVYLVSGSSVSASYGFVIRRRNRLRGDIK